MAGKVLYCIDTGNLRLGQIELGIWYLRCRYEYTGVYRKLDMEIWRYVDMEIWRYRDMEIQRYGDMEI